MSVPGQRVVKSDLVLDHPYVSIRIDTVRDAQGREFEYVIGAGPDVALVVPLWDDGTVTLLEQERHGFDGPSLEVPGGHVDAGETPEQGARRELAEEAGLSCGRLTHLTTVFPSAKLQQPFHLFLAEDLEQGEAAPDADEHFRPMRTPLEEAVARALTGGVQHGTTIAALAAAQHHLATR